MMYLEHRMRPLLAALLGLSAAFSAEPDMKSIPAPRSAAEKQVIAVLRDMARNGGTYLSVPNQDARWLRFLAEAASAKQIVEIGSSTGYSGLWFSLALLRTGGRLTTIELDPGRAAAARSHFSRAGVDHIVTLIQGNAHEELRKWKGPIDVVFIDAEKSGYVDYLDKVLPFVRPGGFILAHNIEMTPDYVKAVSANPDLETVYYMEGAGLGVSRKIR
ncbi:MAG: class I SAM-dependent methyltransferase [Bryobacterales bacterium]|nr:class I SAM-dependent methyltransferase [Bryobacterales bacterium]